MHADHTGITEAQQQLDRTERYLAADPANTDLLALAIDLSLQIGDAPRAARHAQTALTHHPEDAFFRARHGNVLLAQKKWDDAAAVFASVLDAHPDVHLAFNLAYACIWQGRHREAVEAMEPYLQSPDLAPAAVTLLVRAYHHLGELDQAIALVQAHAARCAADADFLAAAGLAYLDAGQAEQAGHFSMQALEQGARPPEALVVAGSLSLARTDSDAAIAYFKEVLALQPAEGRSWSGLGMASLLKNDLDEAALQLEQAVKYLPRHIGTLHTLGWCKIFSKDVAGAEAAFRKALQLDRNFGDSHGGLAVVAALRGERDAAAAGIERALRLDPQSLSAAYAQMVLSGQTEDPVRFRKLAMRLLSSRQGAFGENLAEVVSRHVPD